MCKSSKIAYVPTTYMLSKIHKLLVIFCMSVFVLQMSHNNTDLSFGILTLTFIYELMKSMKYSCQNVAKS